MIHYETDRLILRNYQLDDVQDYYDYMRLPATAEHEDFEPHTLEACGEAVRQRLTDDAYWVVVLKENDKVIGDLCYSKAEYGTYEIAYDFNAAYGKKGYATEACGVLVRHLFTEVGARRLYAGCNEGNTGSWHLLERLGFRREGHGIEDVTFKQDAQGNPIYVSSYYYALLKAEWTGRQEA